MTIRVAIIAACAIAFAGAALAAPLWTRPAWYVVADTIVGPFVWMGPYDSKEACDAVRPANEEDADYVCEYLNEQPSFDD